MDPVRHLCRSPLLLVRIPALTDALQNLLAVLVELELGDLNLGWGDANGDGLAVRLLAGDTLDVHDVLETVDAGDLALATLVAATLNDNFVVLADGDCADLIERLVGFERHCFVRFYIVLLPEFYARSAFLSSR